MTSSRTAKMVPSALCGQCDIAEVSQLTNTVYWRKSMASGGGECVEVAMNPGNIQVRDSKNPWGSALEFTRAEWASFMIGLQRDEFDPPMEPKASAWWRAAERVESAKFAESRMSPGGRAPVPVGRCLTSSASSGDNRGSRLFRRERTGQAGG